MKTLTNETPLEAGWTTAFRQDGRELIVVVAKATFVLVDVDGEDGRLADAQEPLIMADVFGEDPGSSAPIMDNDYAATKPECDLIVVGEAHAPSGRPVTSLRVSLELGSISKSFTVTGNRRWRPGLTSPASAGAAEPFVVQPISYDVAFGGVEVDPHRPDHFDTFLDNPVGRGFRKRNLDVVGQLMPLTEELGEPIKEPGRAYRPMAFGPLGRNWRPRAQYVGTYDQNWMDNVAPMLPADFDPRYFQAAPADQRVPYPRGGERIRLINLVPVSLSPNASADAYVPRVPLALVFVPVRGEPVWIEPNLDTIVIEPSRNLFTCTWRGSYVAVRDGFEVGEVVLYERTPQDDQRVRARVTGKEYFEGLAQLVEWRAGRQR